MGPARRRVSYVVPPPYGPIPRLLLPPPTISKLGSVGPLLLQQQPHHRHTYHSSSSAEEPTTTHPEHEARWRGHPRHRLGVPALALDTSTRLADRPTPEGILYSGGRDGLVISWDLRIAMQKRKHKPYREEASKRAKRARTWEAMTGWADNSIEEEGEEAEEKVSTDGDVLGEVGNRLKTRRANADEIPYEHQWEMDVEPLNSGKLHSPRFRQCIQAHNDWINDLLLCNHNQTIVSASSDGTVKAWNPHSQTFPEPATIGVHNDYIRCLAYCREQGWIASGSFDRTIKLWDSSRTTRPEMSEPLLTLKPPDANAPKASIYAVATDPFGKTIASGSPERVIRLWDPRTGKRTGKLVGHTDNIRTILISEDARYLLTGSADASIKLWSLASQRCLHTFIHHTESVWSLFSSHPSLECFYSGDKTGLVCRVDVEGCSDVSEGECIVLCKDKNSRGSGIASSQGINRIIVMDDSVLWTVTGDSSIKRWRVPPRRAVRASTAALKEGERSNHIHDLPLSRTQSIETKTLPTRDNTPVPAPAGVLPPNHGRPRPSSIAGSVSSETWSPSAPRRDPDEEWGIPLQSLVRLTSHNDYPFIPSMAKGGRDAEVSTLYSTASLQSVPKTNHVRSPLQSLFPPRSHPGSPQREEGPNASRLGIEDAGMPANTARAQYELRELATDAQPLRDLPDDVIEGESGLVRSVILDDRIHALTVDTSGEVAVWDLVRCRCLGKYLPEDVAAAEQRANRIITNGGSDDGGSSSFAGERSPKGALDAVRECIEGEAVVVPWSSVDTKTGVLTVHITERCFEGEIYADELAFNFERPVNDDARINIGRWVLRNLFLGFVREEQRMRRTRDRNANDGGSQAGHHRADGRSRSDLSLTSPHKRLSSSGSSITLRSLAGSAVVSSPEFTPAIVPIFPHPVKRPSLQTPMISLHPITRDERSTPPVPYAPSSEGRHTVQRRRSNLSEAGHPPMSSSSRDSDYFTIRSREPPGAGQVPSEDHPKRANSQDSGTTPTPLSPSGAVGLMGRLKSLGKSSSKKTGEPGHVPIGPPGTPNTSETLSVVEKTPSPSTTKTPLQLLLSGSISPPSSSEAPTLVLPPHTPIILSEDKSHGWTTLYRCTVSMAQVDLRVMEEAMPMWLLEYLLMNRYPALSPTKISFIMLPWPTIDPEQQLPELLNSAQSKLTASRFLRVRKLTIHVHEKLERMMAVSQSSLHSNEIPTTNAKHKPEDLYEILCNDVLLPLNMTLAAVRQHVWKQSAELILCYRRRIIPPSKHRGGNAKASQR